MTDLSLLSLPMMCSGATHAIESLAFSAGKNDSIEVRRYVPLQLFALPLILTKPAARRFDRCLISSVATMPTQKKSQ